jgi:uncharacterized membrane protein YfcA
MLFLGFIVFLAFLTEAIVGFGSVIITVTLGAHVLGIDALLARFLPLNLLLSALLLVRAGGLVEGRLIGRFLLPPVGVGMGLGLLLARYQAGPWLRLAFGVFVVLLAAIELGRLLRDAPPPTSPRPALDFGLLVLGGLVHGLFGTGGPVVVYVLSRRIPERGAMRATLAALWVMLNTLLLGSFVAQDKLSSSTLRDSLILVPSLVLGLTLGERLHHQLPERPFRWMVYLVLLLAGGSLTVRTLLQG